MALELCTRPLQTVQYAEPCVFLHSIYWPTKWSLYKTIKFSHTIPYFLTPWSRVLLETLTGFQLVKKFHAFYGTRRFITALTSARHLSLSCASLIQSIPPHSTSRRSILIISSIYVWVSQAVSFPQLSLPKPCIQLSSPPYLPPAPSTSFFSILSPEQYRVRSTDHEAPHYVVFSIPLVPRPSWAQIFSSAPHSQTPSAYISPSMRATKFHTHTKQAKLYFSVSQSYIIKRASYCQLLHVSAPRCRSLTSAQYHHVTQVPVALVDT